MERPFLAVGPQVKLQGLQLDTELILNIANPDGGEVRLSGARANAGKFGTFHIDLVVPCGPRIGKSFERFAGRGRHGRILTQPAAISNAPSPAAEVRLGERGKFPIGTHRRRRLSRSMQYSRGTLHLKIRLKLPVWCIDLSIHLRRFTRAVRGLAERAESNR